MFNISTHHGAIVIIVKDTLTRINTQVLLLNIYAQKEMFVSWINAWHHVAGISLSNSGSREII